MGPFLVRLLVASSLFAAPSANAQSVLDRPANMHGTWSGQAGTVYFNFVHRFADSGPPVRKVINYPTFLLGTGVGGDAFAGIRYGSNSDLVTGIPNEWEAFARYTALSEADGRPFDLTVHGGYNHAAESVDGELTLARDLGGRVRLMAAGRAFSDAFASGEGRGAWAVGGVLHLTEHIALAADYAELLDRNEGEDGAWSAALQVGIPYTPHSLSLQASNASTTTLQGSSIGVPETRYGFEFTVPITLSRYFGGREGSTAQVPEGSAGGEVAAEVGMTNRLEFTPDTVRIRVGETVRWTNSSALVHTVTLDPEKALDAANVRMPDGAATFDSGDLAPEAVFEYTFEVAGEYRYVCLPHEAAGMVGVVVVEPAGEEMRR